MADDAKKLILNKNRTRTIGVMTKEDLIDMLKAGDIVVIDETTGQYVSELFGVKLPHPDQVLSGSRPK